MATPRGDLKRTLLGPEAFERQAWQVARIQDLLGCLAALPGHSRPDIRVWDGVLGPLWRKLFAKGDDIDRAVGASQRGLRPRHVDPGSGAESFDPEMLGMSGLLHDPRFCIWGGFLMRSFQPSSCKGFISLERGGVRSYPVPQAKPDGTGSCPSGPPRFYEEADRVEWVLSFSTGTARWSLTPPLGPPTPGLARDRWQPKSCSPWF